MPTFEIYQAGRRVASKQFRGNFYIVKELDNTLSWEADEEQGRSKKGGAFQIWVQTLSLAPPKRQILFVRPDWKLIIDGVEMDQQYYEAVDVEGKTIELHHGDYGFVCTFGAQDELGQTTAG